MNRRGAVSRSRKGDDQVDNEGDKERSFESSLSAGEADIVVEEAVDSSRHRREAEDTQHRREEGDPHHRRDADLDRKLYEDQLAKLQEQLEASLMEKMELQGKSLQCSDVCRGKDQKRWWAGVRGGGGGGGGKRSRVIDIIRKGLETDHVMQYIA